MLNQVQDQLLRPDQVAERLAVHVRTVRRLASEGQFLCLMVRGSLRIWQSSVDAYIKRQENLFQLENGILGTNGTDGTGVFASEKD